MSENKSSEITQILQDWNDGNEDAKERLMPFVYDEIKRQARILMSRERSNHTLQPTALVHEAFMKLAETSGIDWQNRSHFYGIASRLMRQILFDHARLHAAEKRGANPIHFSFDDVQIPVEERTESMTFSSLLWEGKLQIRFARATTPGQFVVPTAKAEEMYHPETFGRTGTDFVNIE